MVGGCATKVYGKRIHQLAAQQLWGGGGGEEVTEGCLRVRALLLKKKSVQPIIRAQKRANVAKRIRPYQVKYISYDPVPAEITFR